MGRVRSLWHVVKEFLWGLFVYDLYHETLRLKAQYKNAVNLLLFSEHLGVPLMNAYVSLRLFPYFVGDLEKWKRKQLMDRDVLEDAPDLH